MKVKIADKIYDSENEPIMIILSDADKKNISNMCPECTKYLSYPEKFFKNDDIVYAWMKTD